MYYMYSTCISNYNIIWTRYAPACLCVRACACVCARVRGCVCVFECV